MLEVHFKRRGLWSLASLEGYMTNQDLETSMYGRTTALFFVVYLILLMTADAFLFTVRLYIVFLSGPVSPFIYKNFFYLVLRGSHCFALLILVASGEKLRLERLKRTYVPTGGAPELAQPLNRNEAPPPAPLRGPDEPSAPVGAPEENHGGTPVWGPFEVTDADFELEE